MNFRQKHGKTRQISRRDVAVHVFGRGVIKAGCRDRQPLLPCLPLQKRANLNMI